MCLLDRGGVIGENVSLNNVKCYFPFREGHSYLQQALFPPYSDLLTDQLDWKVCAATVTCAHLKHLHSCQNVAEMPMNYRLEA